MNDLISKTKSNIGKIDDENSLILIIIELLVFIRLNIPEKRVTKINMSVKSMIITLWWIKIYRKLPWVSLHFQFFSSSFFLPFAFLKVSFSA